MGPMTGVMAMGRDRRNVPPRSRDERPDGESVGGVALASVRLGADRVMASPEAKPSSAAGVCENMDGVTPLLPSRGDDER